MQARRQVALKSVISAADTDVMIDHLPAQGARYGAFASRETESLATRTVDYDLHLQTADGREVSVSLDLETLDYQRTYTAAGVIAGHKGPPGQAARVHGAEQALQQAAAYQEHQSLSYSSFSLEIEGDVSLLEDFFGAEPTAQRIFDHVSGLLGKMGADSAGFDDAVAEITAGVADGFQQAAALFGQPLPQVSNDTKTLLDAMLNDLTTTGDRNLNASDYLDLLLADDEVDE